MGTRIWDDEEVLELDSGGSCRTLNIQKTRIVSFKRINFAFVNYISVFKKGNNPVFMKMFLFVFKLCTRDTELFTLQNSYNV